MEIQQGAAGLLTGAGHSGGTLNLVRKRPTESFQAQVEAELGSWDKKRLVGDLSGPLTQSGALRGRAVVVSDESDSFVDHVFNDKQAFYGVLEVVPSADTRIGLGLQYQKNKYRTFDGVPTARDGRDVGWDRSTFIGDSHADSKNENSHAFLYLEQKLAGDWIFKANYAHGSFEEDMNYADLLNGTGLDPSTGDGMLLWRGRSVSKTEADSVDIHASGPAQFFGRRHEFAFGFNGAENKSCFVSKAAGAFLPVNVYTFHPSQLPAYEKPSVDCDLDRSRQQGVWGVARLNIADPLKVILGARVSWYDYKNARGIQTMEENAEFSPYAGIVYDLNERLSVYASYSDIFRPQSVQDRTGSVLKPIVGNNYEAGVKGEFFNKRLNAAAAVFRLEQTNMPTQDVAFGYPNGVCATWCFYASGKVITEGVDLSLNGALSSNWDINAGYTYANSEYTKDMGTNRKGDRYEPRVPKQIFRVATTYKIPGSGWTVGGNLRAQSAAYYTSFFSARVKQGGFALLGLMAKYQINPQAEISITANNVFDRRYRYPGNTNMTSYGEPRSVFANLKYSF